MRPKALKGLFTVSLGFLLLAVPWHLVPIPRPTPYLTAPVPGSSVPYFVQNVGQLVNMDISYYGEGHSLAVGFTNRAVLLRITEGSPYLPGPGGRSGDDGGAPTGGVMVRIAFQGANSIPPEGREELPHRTNFFLGNDPTQWRNGARSYHEVVYRNLYDGVDLAYRASNQGLKYEFLVNGNADPGQIRLSYEGVNGLSLDPSGDLLVSTAVGELRDAAPVAYRDGRQVPCSYALTAPMAVGLRCADADGRGPLVIDPLVYSTFLGGGLADQAWGMTVDAAGNAYVTGSTLSPDFPTTPGAFNASARGGRDAFVAKLNATGSGLVYSTYLGGAGSDDGFTIAVDASGNAFVAGRTTSTDFPTTPGAFDRTCGTDGNCNRVGGYSYYDAFLVKLNPAGDALDYATFLGGGGHDEADSVAFDAQRAAYVTGDTQSPDFSTTPGAFDRTCGTDGNCNFDGVNYYSDAFLAKVQPAGDALGYSTFLGGASYDGGHSLKVDSAGNAYVTGTTGSNDFPTTPGAFQQVWGNDTDAFVVMMNPTGTVLVYSTFLGGSGDDTAESIVVDASGEVYVAGMTRSSDFSTTPGAFDRTQNSPLMYDMFVAKLTATGSGLLYSTFLGGSGEDGWAYGNLGVTAAGEALVTGLTNSPNFPTTPGAFQRSKSGGYDVFLTKLNVTGGGLVYSTFLGGQMDDYGRALAIDAAGDAYVAGATSSIDFPTTPGAFGVLPAGGGDAFVLKFAPLPDLTVAGVSTDPAPPVPVGSPATITVNVTNVGDVDAPPFPVLAFEDRNGNAQFDPGEDIGVQDVASLPVFVSASLDYSWTPDAAGLHRLCAFADFLNVIREGNETNNLLCTDVLAVEPVLGPDYAPQDPEPASPLTVGLSLDVPLSVRVANVGNGSANRTATLAFFNASTPGTPFATFVLPPLAAAETSAPFLATWRSPAVPGTYGIVADVDHGDDLAEWDEANNVYTWTIDVVSGPVTMLVVGTPSYAGAVTYVTSATDLSFSVLDQSGTGIRRTIYRVDNGTWDNYTATGPFRLSGEGERFLQWYSEDYAANVEATQSAVLRVDDTPPTTSLTIGDPKYLVGGTYMTSATPLALSGNDGGVTPVGIAGTEYQIDGGGWLPYVAPFTLSGEGPHAVAYRSVDLLGNLEFTSSATVVVDDSAPAVALTVGTPAYTSTDTWVTSRTPLQVAASDPGPDAVGLDRTEYRVDGGGWTPYASPFTLSGDGPHLVEARAWDRLGHGGSAARSVIVDDTPPGTTITPRVGPHTQDTVFALNATDSGSGVARTEYRVDDGSWTSFTGGFSLPLGNHTIRYRSIDRLNNTEAERTLSVTIEGAPPPAPAANWKPLVAAIFATILVLAGWRASRSRWAGARIPRKPRLRVFATIVLPFIGAEVATGIVSGLTGLLSIPPILGVGTAIDLGILAAGLGAAINEVRRWRPPRSRSSSGNR